MPDPILLARGLGRDYGSQRAVDDLDLAVQPGSIYGFVGPNGAGKTTTIRMLAGILRPTRGELRIDGKTYAEDGEAIRRITGLVPDTPPLYDYLTARQYIGFVGSLYGIPAEQRDADAARLLDALRMTDAADELCKGYSHGMRKKAHLVAVLVTRPRLLLLDEPTTGLDPRSARHLKDLLLAAREQGTTIFLSTHILTTAEELCDAVGILAGGRLVAEGPLAELRAARDDESLEEIFMRLTEDESAGREGRDAGAAAS